MNAQETIYTNVVDPQSLTTKDLHQIFELEQDMWSRDEWLWEYLSCNDCNKIYSKQDIYNKSTFRDYVLTVAEIEKKHGKVLPKCSECDGEMQHVLAREEWIEEITERYAQQSHLIVMKSWEDLIWFMDGYIGSYDRIYEQEFSQHYGKIWKNNIAQLIENTIEWNMPDEMFSCCSMWTREGNMNLIQIYRLLQWFFVNFPALYDQILGISEVRSGGSLDKMYSKLWSQDIGVKEYENQITCSETYDSRIFVQKSLWSTYKKAFSKDLRTFLRKRAI